MRGIFLYRWLASSSLSPTGQVIQTLFVIEIGEEVVAGSGGIRVCIKLCSLVDSLNDLVCFDEVFVSLCLLGDSAVRLAELTLV